MSELSINHATFVIEKTYPVTVERAFAAFSKPNTKRLWFAEGPGFEVNQFDMDFKIGGLETSKFTYVGEGAATNPMTMGNDTVYLDIIDNKRIVLAYTMTVNEKRISSSLASVEFIKDSAGVKVVFTEQGAFFDGSDGPEGRKAGWEELLAQLEKALLGEK